MSFLDEEGVMMSPGDNLGNEPRVSLHEDSRDEFG